MYREGFGPGAVRRWRLSAPQDGGSSPIDTIDAHLREASAYGAREHLWDDPNDLLQETAEADGEGEPSW